MLCMAPLIKDLIHTILPSDRDWKLKLLQEWSSIMGNLSSHVRLEKIQEDCLILGVYDSSWMQELYLLTPFLLQTINEKLDQPRIKQLRFKYVSSFKKEKKAFSSFSAKAHATITLTKQEENALDAIGDPELKKALRSFLVRCYGEK